MLLTLLVFTVLVIATIIWGGILIGYTEKAVKEGTNLRSKATDNQMTWFMFGIFFLPLISWGLIGMVAGR